MKFYLSIAALLVAIYWLFLSHVQPVDLNGESIANAMSIGYLQHPEKPMWDNFKEQDYMAYGAPWGHFHGDWPALSSPFIMACYWPFVAIYGVSPMAVGAYSTFFSLLAIALTFYLAWSMYDKWTALIACFMLISSLSWLIHTKACVQQAMPSVCLMIGIVICAYQKRYLLWGMLLGMTVLTGWIVAPFAVIFSTLAILASRIDSLWVVPYSIVWVANFTNIYSLFVPFKIIEIVHGVWLAFTHRFNQGSVPEFNPSIIGKIWYAIKLTFIDMKAVDHPDKYFEGYPAIPVLFTIMFFIGLWQVRRNNLLWFWLISTYGVMMTVYLFSGRYSLMALPCLAIIAGICLKRLCDRFRCPALKVAFIGLIALSVGMNGIQYAKFRDQAPFNFERDRQRGHAEFAEWLKANYNPSDTIVVLNDPVSMSAWQLMFYTFNNPYRFIYWDEYSPQSQYKNIVYVISIKWNADIDKWMDLGKSHPESKINFTYNYNKETLFAAIVVHP